MTEDPLQRGFPPLVGRLPVGLILGSAPGRESLLRQQYYGHPRNRFWSLWSELLGWPAECTYEQRVERFTAAGLALWDVAQEFRRPGSLDSDFREVRPNPLDRFLLEHPNIVSVALNGRKAEQIARRYGLDEFCAARGIGFAYLPSTSPTNAGYSYSTLLESWGAWASELPCKR